MVLSGCSTVGYYMNAIHGHLEILDKSRPIDDVISDNNSEELTNKLKNFQQAREFATNYLLLPANNSYTEYADIGRQYAVWNVIATPRFSVEPKKWCFLFAGCISYRGYFNKQEADEYAEQLADQGYDVYVAGARAYSTLGWFDDPLLNTMMYKSEAARVAILFHELAHQKIYVENDSAFNEAFASTIEQEGVRRWFIYRKQNSELTEYEKHLTRKNELNSLLLKYRNKLKNIYNKQADTKVVLEKKKKLFEYLKHDYAALKIKWKGYDGYDKWMEQDLNNAHLAIVATYNDLVPVFTRKLNETRDIAKFYKYILKLVQHDPEKRNKLLTIDQSR